MNKNRNKVAAMMMVAAITVSSVAMPVEAAVSSIESVGIEREGTVDQEIKDVVLNKVNFPDDAFRERLAEKLAKTVIKTGKSITLEPMSAYERKIIHTHLQENHKVKTYSIGEEPNRKVIIELKK